MLKYEPVTENKIEELAQLARGIWQEYWTELLSKEQIDYMVEKFQSAEAIKKQYENEKYRYYFIEQSGKKVGYFGISDKADYLFLSKLYILKGYRHRGIGRDAFEKIKELALEKGYRSIRLTVNKYNKNTIMAYKKWGLKTINSVVTDIGKGFVMDDYIMEYTCPTKYPLQQDK